MKTLLILRHAKSSWDDASLPDFERPLNERGRRTAPFMGELMTRRGYVPDIVISSPAVRARDTARAVHAAAGLESPVRFDDRIYEASVNRLKEVVTEIEEEATSAMIVGHNPGIEGLVRHLTGRLEPMPTAALAVISLNIDRWAAASAESGHLVDVYRPKKEMKASEG